MPTVRRSLIFVDEVNSTRAGPPDKPTVYVSQLKKAHDAALKTLLLTAWPETSTKGGDTPRDQLLGGQIQATWTSPRSGSEVFRGYSCVPTPS